MHPTLEPGDLLTIDTEVECFRGPGLYAVLCHETAIIVRLQETGPGMIQVRHDGEHYDHEEPIHIGSLQIIGRVAFIGRRV